MQLHVLKSLFKKELAGYFSNPTGYVFITLFVFLSGLAAFWTPSFFERNLANLDQLNSFFGLMLVFLIPAITMASWANERQEGTDELLMTLPATELELVVGKYLGCVAIYAVCLLFASSHILVLAFLGRPDAGVMASTYLGYFLSGAALVAIGLAASSLSASATISYIAGALCCGCLVGVSLIERLVPNTTAAMIASSLSLPRRLDSLDRGVIDPADIAYFLGIAVIGIALCVAVISARRAGTRRAYANAIHMPIRGVSLLVALACALILLDRSAVRVDATAERLWSVSPHTREIIAKVPSDRPLAISAYISPKVPEAFVQQRESLLGMLREVEALSHGRIQVRVVPVTSNSEQAREAEKSFGIVPRAVPSDTGTSAEPIFLGFAITGGADGSDRAVVPFLSRGLSVEYELTRALRAVTTMTRKRVGILDTPAALFAQFDFQTMQPGRDWPIIAELRKQYEVVLQAPTTELKDDLDVLIVPQPSTLTPQAVNRLIDYIKKGKATLILEDPMPLVNPGIATAEARLPRNPMAGREAAPQFKADISALYNLLGAKVPGDAVVWDTANPHPSLAESPPEFIWVARNLYKSGQPAFNDADPITAGLQECVMLFPGRIERIIPPPPPAPKEGEAAPKPPAPPEFETLLRSGPASGQMPYGQLLARSQFGMAALNPNRRPNRINQQQTLAARITGGENKLNVIVVADLDMISDTFFGIRESGAAGLEFDNVTFILNCVDTLAGDGSLVDLRKRRQTFRTLERVEARRQAEQTATQEAIKVAETDADAKIAEARQRFDARIAEIKDRKDLDETTRNIMMESVRQAEQRKLDAQSAAIEDAKRQRIEDERLKSRTEIDQIQMEIRIAAVTLPPIPALAMGLIVFIRRRASEQAVIARASTEN